LFDHLAALLWDVGNNSHSKRRIFCTIIVRRIYSKVKIDFSFELIVLIFNRYGLLSKNHSSDLPSKICRHILEENKLTEWQLG
jgi:hypothetical protein